MVQLETKSVELKAKKNELDERITTLKSNLEKIENDHTSSIKAFVDAKQKFDSLGTNESEEKEERQKIELLLSQINNEIKAIEGKNQITQKEITKLHSEQARLTAQIEVLTQADSSLAGLNQGAKTIINASKSGRIPGKYLPISNSIEVPKKYETAISAALGEFLDAVILLDESDPDAAMQLLSIEDQGRAVIMPLALLKNQEKI